MRGLTGAALLIAVLYYDKTNLDTGNSLLIGGMCGLGFMLLVCNLWGKD